MRLLMVFIDGFGLGPGIPESNPFLKAETPFIRSLLSGLPLTSENVDSGITRPGVSIQPTDALLGVKGLPQSATGQTVLFTGVNAAKIAGRHINGFPTKALRTIINQYSIFKVLSAWDKKSVFANTFTREYFATVERGRWRHSVTTTAAMAGKSRLRMIPDLLRGEAVYQDITNEQLVERGYPVPVVEPEEAALQLLNVATQNDFTLFEYFQTDRCGHKQDWELALRLINRLDRFLGTIAARLDDHELNLLVVSDHGNIEDLSVKPHTMNKVPTISIGARADCFQSIESLMDIYPSILRFFGLKPAESECGVLILE